MVSTTFGAGGNYVQPPPLDETIITDPAGYSVAAWQLERKRKDYLDVFNRWNRWRRLAPMYGISDDVFSGILDSVELLEGYPTRWSITSITNTQMRNEARIEKSYCWYVAYEHKYRVMLIAISSRIRAAQDDYLSDCERIFLETHG
jgi:hypothetical protein